MSAVTIVDYGLANLRSVVNAFEYLGAEVTVAAEPAALEQARLIVLPGVGSYGAGMRGLRQRGLVEPLERLVLGEGRPYLGICLGMQFLLEGSEEDEEPGLGWLEGRVRRFPQGPEAPKVPHIGWNDVSLPAESRLFAGIEPATDFYFVHSYYLPTDCEAARAKAGLCTYGLAFLAAFERDNLYACQFHPEKSQLAGMKLLQNFLVDEAERAAA